MSSARRHPVNAASVTRQVLPNGVTLLVYPNPASPSVAVGGYHAAGSVLETRGAAGLASLTAEALTRGTAGRTFLEFSQALDNVGASLSFHALTEFAALGGSALAEDLGLLLDLMADALHNPTFPDEEVERLRDQTLTAIAQVEDRPSARAARRFRELLYGPDTPNGWPEEGYARTVARLTAGDLRDFHARAYAPATLTLAVVGAVDPERAAELAAATVGTWNAAPAAVSREGWGRALRGADGASAPAEPQRDDLTIAGKTQTEFLLGWLGLRRADPTYYAAIAANFILGQLGLGGRIGDNVRDTQGLAYHASSYMDAGLTRQPWTLRAGVNPANVDRAIAACRHEVQRLMDTPPGADELQLTKRALIGSLPLRLERNSGVARTLLGMERHGLGLDYLDEFPARVESLTPEAVRQALVTVMSSPNSTLVTAGPDLAASG